MIKDKKIAIFWFRRDLRLYDNTALNLALNSKYPVVPIFIFDTNILGKLENPKDARVQFIHNEIFDIKAQLEMHESSMHVFYGKPEQVFIKLLSDYKIAEVFANKDYEPYALERDQRVRKMLEDNGVRMHLSKDHVIFDGSEVVKRDGTPFRVFTPYKRAWLSQLNGGLKQLDTATVSFEKFLKIAPKPMISLSDMGFEKFEFKYPARSVDNEVISKYDKTRDFPAKNGTSRLGLHLRFGTISIREMVAVAIKTNDTWQNELIWREFYSSILQHFPHVVQRAFNSKYDRIPWINNEHDFLKWCEGKTGYPIVDAGMRELNETGYMHNRVRMITASFLTKHLLIDWRWGEAYFAAKLLDFELASNNGGWQWAAGTGTDAQPYFRVFNPDSQTEKFDHEKKYIRKWVPEYGTSAYPKPMIDHKAARLRAIETYKRALA